MLEWLIIGGGIHGTYLANLLVHGAGVAPDDIRIIDPHDHLLHVWRRHTRNCGMAYLRSPVTHNIDLHILSIHRFAKTEAGKPLADFIPPYYRPSLELFQTHCDSVIRERKLDALHRRATATALKSIPDGIATETDTGRFESRRVILAPGMSDVTYLPPWAEELRRQDAPVAHVFDLDFKRRHLAAANSIAVVGGGITAVQLAIALHRETDARVSLIARHGIRKNNLDFDPCWIGPKCLKTFLRTEYPKRRIIVDEARNRGTVPEETAAALDRNLDGDRLTWIRGSIRSARFDGGGILLETSAGLHRAEQVVLATGFDSRRPGGALTDQIIDAFGLPTAGRGFPVLDRFFRWHSRIFVSGGLAELQGGPCSRNIVGARNTGRAILAYLRSPDT